MVNHSKNHSFLPFSSGVLQSYLRGFCYTG